MRKIIDGLRYDTENAIEIGRYSSGHKSSDFQGWHATLYKTPRSGRFFLHGGGGPMTRFASRSGNNCAYGEKIIPMACTEALSWAEQYLDADKIEPHFFASIQDA